MRAFILRELPLRSDSQKHSEGVECIAQLVVARGCSPSSCRITCTVIWLFLLLVIQGKYHFDYLLDFRATLHLLSPYSLIGASLPGSSRRCCFHCIHGEPFNCKSRAIIRCISGTKCLIEKDIHMTGTTTALLASQSRQLR